MHCTSMPSSQAALFLLVAISTSLFSLPSSEAACGGVISVDPCRQTTFDYKYNQNYTNLELCVWALTSLANNVGPVNITIQAQGFEANWDGLTAYSFDSSVTSVQNCTFTSSLKTCIMTGYNKILVFTSDSTGIGTGFRVLFNSQSVCLTERLYPGARHITTTSGTLSYPLNGFINQGERYMAVIQTNQTNYIQLNQMYSSGEVDWLNIFSIYRYNNRQNLRLDRRWTGNFSEGSPDAYAPSSLPRLIFFESNNPSTFNKFNLSWGLASKADALAEEGPETLRMLEEGSKMKYPFAAL